MEINVPLSQIVVTRSESGVLLFNLLGSNAAPLTSYDLLAIVARTDDKKFAEDLLRIVDAYEADMVVEDTTYWTIRDCVRVRMTLDDDRRGHVVTRLAKKTYLMRDENTGLVKIGCSVNPGKRETTLQSEKPHITLLKVCDDDIETKLHKKYSHKRVRGEWFYLSKEELQDIIKSYNFHDYE